MPALTLYYAPGSSSMAPHIALHEIGVPFERRLVSFARGDTRTREFLELNPEGKVPVLLIDGRPLTEVAAILFYLAKHFPEAALLPSGDVETEARAVSWMSFIASTVHPARRRGRDSVNRVCGIADQRLAKTPWALGSYSIVDIHLFRVLWRIRGSFEVAPDEFPNLSAHYDRMMARTAVQQTCAHEAAVGYELPP